MARPTRTGRSTLGCLAMVLVIVAATYFGMPAAEAYWRYYRYRDALKQALRFHSDLPDTDLRTRLHVIADSLGLPADASQVEVMRTDRSITLESNYDEIIALPGHRRPLHFEARVTRTRE